MVRENGPEVHRADRASAAAGAGFDRVLFWSFRYYQTYFGSAGLPAREPCWFRRPKPIQ